MSEEYGLVGDFSVTANIAPPVPLRIHGEGNKEILRLERDGTLRVDPANITEAAFMLVSEVKRLCQGIGYPFATPAPVGEVNLDKTFAEIDRRLPDAIAADAIASRDKVIGELVKYARHYGLCGIVGGYGYCTCGLDETLRNAETAAFNEGRVIGAGLKRTVNKADLSK